MARDIACYARRPWARSMSGLDSPQTSYNQIDDMRMRMSTRNETSDGITKLLHTHTLTYAYFPFPFTFLLLSDDDGLDGCFGVWT